MGDEPTVQGTPVPFGVASMTALLRHPIPADEVDTLACNVLVVRPGDVVLCAGNPQTAARLAGHGITVHTFAGTEICWNGGGGPTCLTLPLHRGG